MREYKYVFGPIPSRRMGNSLGISPISKRSCSYSCVYCQLGRTRNMMSEPKSFFKVSDIIYEFKMYLEEKVDFDVVTVVGEGEPTLCTDLGEIIDGLKKCTDKPVAVITNGSLLNNLSVRKALMRADIVLPSLDAGCESTLKEINRPNGKINFKESIEGLIAFSKEYKGQLWMETMLVKGINDNEEELKRIKNILSKVRYDRLYINTPVRPPAEAFVEEPSSETVNMAVEILGGTSIAQLSSGGFFSDIEDDFEAIKSIVSRHPMNKFEVKAFLASRKCENEEEIFERLKKDQAIEVVEYKKYITYRLK